MKLYYFESSDEYPEFPDDWEAWNLAILLERNKAIVFNVATGQFMIREIANDEFLKKWPHKTPEELGSYLFEMVFEYYS